MGVQLVKVALGEAPADLVIRDANLVNVNTAEIEEHVDIAVKGGKIALVGDARHCIGKGTEVKEGRGEYFAPGLLDAHLHIESSMLTLTNFARAVLPRGTTGVFIDPHEIANVFGLRGIQLLMDEAKELPLKVFIEVPSCVPAAPGLETSGGKLGPKEVAKILKLGNVVGLGEVMNFPGVLAGDEKIFREIAAAKSAGKVIEGHAPGVLGKKLSAYISAGVVSDHESSTGAEALEKLRRGMKLEIREGSVTQNLSALLKPILEKGLDIRHCLLATDDIHPQDLLRQGHMDHAIRQAIEEGVDPVRAIQMATVNTVEHLGVLELGDLSPGKCADMISIGDLGRFEVKRVFVDGTLVAEGGRLLARLPSFTYPKFARKSVRLKEKLTPGNFTVRSDELSGKVRVRVISVQEGEILTRSEVLELEVKEGEVSPDPDRDVARVAVVERHRKTGNIGLGFVRGFGIREGALASSVGHDAHNIGVVGVETADMVCAVNEIARTGGGQVVVSGGKPIAELELPIAGLMSDLPAEEVSRGLEKLHLAAAGLGVKLGSPFMTLAFLQLAVVPELRITDRGLVDVELFKLVDPIVQSGEAGR